MFNSSSLLLKVDSLKVVAQGKKNVRPLVNGISFELRQGEVLGIIGESGAGKSTVGLACMGYAHHGAVISNGKILFNGIDLLTLSNAQLRKLRGVEVAYVAQSAAAAFNPSKRLDWQATEVAVRHGLSKREAARARIIELYRKLQLPHPERIGERYPHQVSGGQLQRVMIAMGMSCKPQLLILDEPTTALDVITQVEVLTAARDLIRSSKTSALYITHDLAVVAQLADNIMVLRHGDVMEYGSTIQILEDPHHAYTKTLVSTKKASMKKHKYCVEAEPVVRVNNVSAAYGSVPILENINLEIYPGETVAIVGESGSGKSTLARVMVGLLPPTKGTIHLEQRVLSANLLYRDIEDKRRLQLIYQSPDVALNPKHSVRKILGRPLSFYFGLSAAECDQQVKDLLKQVELPESYIDRFPMELSGGEKQRICIARALAAKPSILICDEITSALDQVVGAGILRLIELFQREQGVTIILITHDLSIAKNMADRTIVMFKGQIVESGQTAEFYASTRALPYTRRLLASVPEMRPGWLDEVSAKQHN